MGALECRGRLKEMAKRDLMVDDRVIDIIKLQGLEGLYRTPSREIDHDLILALVERWWPETYTFHLPHGEMTITLQDEVILGIPIDGEVLVGLTLLDWHQECTDLLGFTIPLSNTTVLMGKEFSSNGFLNTLHSRYLLMHRKLRCISMPDAIF